MALTKVPSNLDATVATTQSASDNSTNVATTAYVTTAIANLVDSSPSALNTLNELAAALNDDASFSTTVNNSIATKLPLAGGTMSGALTINDNLTVDTTTLVVDSSNNRVGIGEASPTRTLSVRRDTGITSGFNDISEFLDSTLGAGGSVSLNIGKAASNKNLGKMAFKYAGNASNSNSLNFGFFNNDNLMSLTADGKLLVGTNSVGTVGVGGLKLYSNIEETLSIDGSAGTQAIHFHDNGTRRGIIGFSNGTSIAGDLSDHDFAIRSETSLGFCTNTSSVKMYINMSGNVGLGTQTPSHHLEALGTDSALTVHYTSQSRGGIAALSGQRVVLTTTTSGDDIAFGYAGTTISSANFVPRMFIENATGNVGIGTTSPASPLHIKTSTNHNLEFEEASGDLRISALNDARNTNEVLQFAASEFNFLTGNVGIGQTNPAQSLDVTGNIKLVGGLLIDRNTNNGSIFFSNGVVDNNHALWNAYSGTNPLTRGAMNSGFDGMYWNVYRGLHIQGGTSGTSKLLTIENSASNATDHVLKLYCSGTERLATSTTGISVSGALTVSGKADFQGTAAIEGGTSGSGYGVFKGYTANNNHMLISRGKLSGTNTNPTITGGHEMTFVEYVGTDTDGFVFTSSHVVNSAYTQMVTFRSSYNLFQQKIRSISTITQNYSDERLKDIHGVIESPLEKVQQLSGFYYTPNQTAQELGYEEEKSIGLSAQAVQKVMPEVVQPAPVTFNEGVEEDYLTIQYEKLVPLLVESIKELKAENDALSARIEALEG